MNQLINKKRAKSFNTIQRNSENSGLSLDYVVNSCHWHFSFSNLRHVL